MTEANGARIRVLVVEDSLTVRRRICEILASDSAFEVVGEAEDGKRAVELCMALGPDVITMDMMLPVMTGLAATEYLMAHRPTPILIVSSSTNRGELFNTYDALAAGAVDVLEKPTGDEAEGVWEERLRAAVKLVSRIRVITHLRGRIRERARVPGASGAPIEAAPPSSLSPRDDVRADVEAPRSASSTTSPTLPRRHVDVLAIGASTGGPGAIVQLLAALPAEVKAPILLVLHIGEKFGVSLAEWLDGQSPRRVRAAQGGELVAEAEGAVLMAPAGAHVSVAGGRVRLTTDPPRHSCRPSVDVLFESIAREYGAASAACLLTGMGRDGASGLLEIRRSGGLTIAQDEATSVIYGMPREAVLLGAAESVLPIGEIGAELARRTRSGRERRA